MKYFLIVLLWLLLSCNKENEAETYYLFLHNKPVIHITETTAQSGGYFHTMHVYSPLRILSMGIVWTTDDPPTLTYNDGRTFDEFNVIPPQYPSHTIANDWTSIMTKLEPNTVYYVRPYVELGDKVYYTAPSVKFKTL